MIFIFIIKLKTMKYYSFLLHLYQKRMRVFLLRLCTKSHKLNSISETNILYCIKSKWAVRPNKN